jgi:GNAT superfamily N-acetyltransferase
VAAGSIEVRPTIDRDWLETVAETEPVVHAYALWNLDRHPDRVRFTSVVRGTATLGYLMLWPVNDGTTIVHWVGESKDTGPLVDHLPGRPLVVVCSESTGAAVEHARGPAVVHPILVEEAPAGAPPPMGPQDEAVRRLRPDEEPALRDFAGRQRDRIGSAYGSIDVHEEPIWAGFDDGRIVALARPAVRLPRLWVVSGVYVDPDRRNRGWARAVVRAVMTEAAAVGAKCGLVVREDSAAARSVYERLGFRTVARRLWVDAGAHREP